jgi:hypothetical protein
LRPDEAIPLHINANPHAHTYSVMPRKHATLVAAAQRVVEARRIVADQLVANLRAAKRPTANAEASLCTAVSGRGGGVEQNDDHIAVDDAGSHIFPQRTSSLRASATMVVFLRRPPLRLTHSLNHRASADCG